MHLRALAAHAPRAPGRPPAVTYRQVEQKGQRLQKAWESHQDQVWGERESNSPSFPSSRVSGCHHSIQSGRSKIVLSLACSHPRVPTRPEPMAS
eukprot:361365-Chlamydomonas_euryale.AAC.4